MSIRPARAPSDVHARQLPRRCASSIDFTGYLQGFEFGDTALFSGSDRLPGQPAQAPHGSELIEDESEKSGPAEKAAFAMNLSGPAVRGGRLIMIAVFFKPPACGETQ